MVQGVTVTISDGRMFLKGIAAGKKEDLYTFLWDEIYTGEIHTFAKCTRLNVATAPLGLLLVFYKIEIIKINSSMLQSIS